VLLATGKSVRVREDTESSYSQNEFLVYDQSQVQLRYLVLVRLHSEASARQHAKSSRRCV